MQSVDNFQTIFVSLRQMVKENDETQDYYEQISGNVFINCRAKNSGGGLFIYCHDEHHSRRYIHDIDDENKYLIFIQTCEFINSASEVEGGAICSGLMTLDEYDRPVGIAGDNDMRITDCKFRKCGSGCGGALYFQDGTREGDEETLIENCEFESCYANGTTREGYAISCRSYQITIHDCNFYHHTTKSSMKSTSILIVQTNEDNVSPILNNLIFTQNNNIPSLIVSSYTPVTISNSIFDSSPLFIHESWNITQVRFNSCQFLRNIGENGGAISIISNSRSLTNNNNFTFNECKFADNIAKQGGCIYFNRPGRLSLLSCIFYNNSATENGGSIYSSAYTEIINCNFTLSSAPKGSFIYLVLNQNATIENIVMDFDKKPGQTAIYITGTNSSNSLLMGGTGCFIPNSNNTNDSKPDFIEFDSKGSVQFTGDMCFSGSIDSSIKLPQGTQLNQPSWFNCNKCAPPIPWTPTYPPINVPTRPYTPTPNVPISSYTLSFTNDGNGSITSKSKSKLSAGAIAGIVIGIVVFIALIVLLVILLIRRRSLSNSKRPEEAVSQEVESAVYTNNEKENPLWSEDLGGSNDQAIFTPSVDNANFENNDPFMKEFEEGF